MQSPCGVRSGTLWTALLWVLTLWAVQSTLAATYRSCPPMRPLPPVSGLPAAKGPAYYVDSLKGDDAGPGTEKEPWRTVQRGVSAVKPGDALCLRGGTYYEHVTCTVTGRANAWITIRSYPGELAVIDGGFREFAENPAEAWEPAPSGVDGEFQSVSTFPAIGGKAGSVNVLGSFGDSMVPLHGYRYFEDLRSASEFWSVEVKTEAGVGMYCGPGVAYDPASHRIHVRLAHTTLEGLGPDNYGGETDPRRLPLVIAAGPEPPLKIVGSACVRVWDLAVRGSRVATLQIQDSHDIELDGVTAYGGASAAGASGTERLKIRNCAFRGISGPWSSRSTMKYRGIESKLFAASGWYGYAGNRDFDIGYSEFTDSCDGVFIGNTAHVAFHHNLLDNCSDDGLFVTATTGEDGLIQGGGHYVYQNVLSRCLTALAFGTGHGVQKEIAPGVRQTGAGLYIYRNVFDLRRPVYYHHPGSREQAREIGSPGRTTGDHGSPVWEPMFIYHNTVIVQQRVWRGYYGLGLSQATRAARHLLNNVFVQLREIPGVVFPPGYADFSADGNLHWSVADGPAYGGDFAATVRSTAEAASKLLPPPPPEKLPPPPKIGDAVPADDDLIGETVDDDAAEELIAPDPPKPEPAPVPEWGTHDRFADPAFVSMKTDWSERCDVRLAAGSPAIDTGVIVPAEWRDPLRAADADAPDIGAIPQGQAGWRIGVRGRLAVGAP